MLFLIILAVAVLGNLTLGFLVYNHQNQSATNRFFLVLTLASIFWSVMNYLSVNQDSAQDTLLFARQELFAGAIYSLAAFLTVHTFPSPKLQLKPIYLIGLIGFTTLILYLIQTPLIFKSVTGEGTHVQVIPGPAIPLFAIFNIILIFGSFIILYKRILISSGKPKVQLYFLILAVFVGNFIAFFNNFVLVNLFKITALLPAGPFLSLLFTVITAYAILAHRLFDIRVIIRRTLVYSGLLLTTLATYSLIIFLFAAVIGRHNGLTAQGFITNLVAALAISIGFEPLRRLLQEKTDQFLFKKEYEEETVLKELTQKLNSVVDLDEALETVMQTIVRVLHLHHAASFVFQLSENGQIAVKRIKQIGYSSTTKLLLEERDFTTQFFSSNPNIVIVDELEHYVDKAQKEIKDSSMGEEELSSFIRSQAIRQAVLKKLRILKVAVAVPLHINQQPIGLLILSDKRSQEGFTSQDLNLIEVIGAQAISSIQKARLFEGDQMKTEFVSIASHELLTPISAIEGYLSMILDEHIGTVDSQAHEYLDKVYGSARRLSALVKDLLSASRIEANRMKIAPQSLDMDLTIKQCIAELKPIADEKKLEIIYESPKTPLPPAWADYDRTLQILINLVSNSIKYTKSGSVEIRVARTPKAESLSIDVQDTGIGMNHEQQKHLFEKFYRVDSPDTAGIVGTGLGLYITKSIIEKMGGRIHLKSTPGKGTTTTFTLPLFKVELSEMPA